MPIVQTVGGGHAENKMTVSDSTGEAGTAHRGGGADLCPGVGWTWPEDREEGRGTNGKTKGAANIGLAWTWGGWWLLAGGGGFRARSAGEAIRGDRAWEGLLC